MKCSELIRTLKKDGWFVERQSGSHLVMRHLTKKGSLVVPNHGSSEIGQGLYRKIIKDAGIQSTSK